MALIANLTFTAVSADGTTSTLTDSTEYGTPEFDRNEVAVYLTGYKVDEDLVETAITISAIDPDTQTTFSATNTIDGRYKFYFIIVPIWDVATTYNQYDLVWSDIEEKFYEYTAVAPSSGNAVTNLTYFAEVEDPTTKIANVDTDEESGNLVYQVLEKIIDYQTAKCYATAVTKSAKEDCNGTGDCGCGSKLGKAVHRLHTLLTVMRIADTRQQYLEGERFARQAEKYCDECGCLNQ